MQDGARGRDGRGRLHVGGGLAFTVRAKDYRLEPFDFARELVEIIHGASEETLVLALICLERGDARREAIDAHARLLGEAPCESAPLLRSALLFVLHGRQRARSRAATQAHLYIVPSVTERSGFVPIAL